jgi:cysteinyl-tRNA synthetase
MDLSAMPESEAQQMRLALYWRTQWRVTQTFTGERMRETETAFHRLNRAMDAAGMAHWRRPISLGHGKWKDGIL